VGAAHPLQIAAAAALEMEHGYYEELSRGYTEKRDFFVGALEGAGFRVYKPSGAYYIMTDVGHFGYPDDVSFALHLVKEGGVATVPGSAFYSRREPGSTKVRFCFPKKMETLTAAAGRLRDFRP